jgi:predicted nucleic acid-binding protein
MRVMVDNNILSLARFLKPVSLSLPNIEKKLALLRSPKKNVDPAKAAEIEWLPTIGNLVKAEKIRLFTYSYLLNESMRRPGAFPHIRTGYLLDGCKLHFFPNIVSSPLLHFTDFSDSNQKLIDFVCAIKSNNFEWVRSINRDHLPKHLIAKTNPELLLILKSICHNMSNKHYPDAFHFWSAQIYGCDVFLTTDRKLSKIIQRNSQIDQSVCKVLSPTQLAQFLGINAPDRFPYPYDSLFYHSGKLYD